MLFTCGWHTNWMMRSVARRAFAVPATALAPRSTAAAQSLDSVGWLHPSTSLKFAAKTCPLLAIVLAGRMFVKRRTKFAAIG